MPLASSVARAVSEGQTALQGGDLGCVGPSYGVGNEEVVKAAAALKPGELSPIVETPRGFHVLEADAKLEAGTLEASGKRYVARKLYLQAMGDAQVKAFGEEVIKRAKAGAKLEDAVEAQLAILLPAPAKKEGEAKAPPVPALAAVNHPKVEISAPFSMSGNPLPQVTPKEPLAARAFELKNPEDVWQAPILTSEGAVVIQLKEKTAADRAEFDKLKAKDFAPLSEEKSYEALALYVADLRKKAGDKLKVDLRFGEEAKASSKDDE